MKQLAPQLATSLHTFTQLLSSTRRGARLASLLTMRQLQSWSAPQALTERAEIVVAELAANAVLHGSLPGRSFRLTLVCDASPGLLRVEVTDARGDRWPQARPASALSALSDASLHTSGRGLALVAAVADHWETLPYSPSGRPCGRNWAVRPEGAPRNNQPPHPLGNDLAWRATSGLDQNPEHRGVECA
ncbi:ATP-binding protein [Streptomyces diastaticus]|uniref:ATP-binding protein n=1 Tax=Streptomyces diastaticus TaxID=1956 RepID=UPI0036677A71